MSTHLSQGRNYIDRNGDSKQFTVVDWSPKTTVGNTYSPEELSEAKQQLKDYTEKTIKEILAFSPVYAGEHYSQFVLRGDKGIRWDEEKLSLFIREDVVVNGFMLTYLERKKEELHFNQNP